MQITAVWEERDGSIVSYGKELLICPVESWSPLRPREGGAWYLTRGLWGKDFSKLKWASPKHPCYIFPWQSEFVISCETGCYIGLLVFWQSTQGLRPSVWYMLRVLRNQFLFQKKFLAHHAHGGHTVGSGENQSREIGKWVVGVRKGRGMLLSLSSKPKEEDFWESLEKSLALK